jgi:hypothetical protein
MTMNSVQPGSKSDADAATAQSAAAIKAGDVVLTAHWRGPICVVASVGAKQLKLAGRGVLPLDEVLAVYADEASAEAAWRRYRSAWQSAQVELAEYERAAKEAAEARDAARVRLKAWAWSHALNDGAPSASTTDDSRAPGMNPNTTETT